MSMVLNFEDSPATRIGFRFQLPDRRSFVQATGNTEYQFDWFMLEEYDPVSHGTVWGAHTHSPYIENGMSLRGIDVWS